MSEIDIKENLKPLANKEHAEGLIAEFLSKQGYDVSRNVSLHGKSGIEQVFDMVARRDDGLTSRLIGICIAKGGDKETETNTIFNFANKSYDAGVHERVLIAVPRLNPETEKLAEEQHIKVLEEAELEKLVERSAEKVKRPSKPLLFHNTHELIDSLKGMGYRVEEHVALKGKSGVEHTFDLVAFDKGTQNHNMAVDILPDKYPVDLDKIALFDTKSYDCGVYDKVIVISSTLTDEARQFAETQKIKIIKLGGKIEAQTTKKTEAKEGKKEGGKDTSKILSQAPQPEALRLIPEVLARRYNIIPFKIKGNTLEVAMADPTDILALEALAAQSKKRIKALEASQKEVREAIDLNYSGYGEIEKHLSKMSISEEVTDDRLAIDAAVDAPLAQALNLIIEEAVKARASDIHIEPEEDRVRVRYRIDGTLHDNMSLPISTHRAIISRVKILGEMNIADHHRAQDGQFTMELGGRDIDIRVATSPTVNGEMSVMRLLDKSRAAMELSELGMLSESQEKYEKLLKIPYGMILISGPTGAGKTTTLYASINSLDTMGRNIITIEDPAEYRFKDINQIQVNVQAGITFASGLRSILRLDPDVILVGEIRDSETANIAIQAAMTGHLMPSSIHANDSAGALYRLLDLGIEPFLIASAVIGTVAQRMVRRICPYCSRMVDVPILEQMAYERETGEKKDKFMYGAGCKACAYTGYLGRIGVFEILVMDDDLRKMIINNASSAEIRARSIKNGMQTMMNDGMKKVQQGMTTPSEILRSTYSPEAFI